MCHVSMSYLRGEHVQAVSLTLQVSVLQLLSVEGFGLWVLFAPLGVWLHSLASQRVLSF